MDGTLAQLLAMPKGQQLARQTVQLLEQPVGAHRHHTLVLLALRPLSEVPLQRVDPFADGGRISLRDGGPD